jgi:uncharacterized DUF497 family protein
VGWQFEYQLEWDPAKAARNVRDTGVSFERGAAVVCHPFREQREAGRKKSAKIRLISAGRANRREAARIEP